MNIGNYKIRLLATMILGFSSILHATNKETQHKSKKTLTILLFGDHGVGKTSLINSIYNYNKGNEIKEWEYISELKSQYNANIGPVKPFKVYTILPTSSKYSNYEIKIIEAPALNNPTRSTENKEEESSKIIEKVNFLLQGSLGIKIDAIVLVVNATESKLNPYIKKSFNKVKEVMEKNETKLLTFITFSDLNCSANVDSPLEVAGIKGSRFYIQNIKSITDFEINKIFLKNGSDSVDNFLKEVIKLHNNSNSNSFEAPKVCELIEIDSKLEPKGIYVEEIKFPDSLTALNPTINNSQSTEYDNPIQLENYVSSFNNNPKPKLIKRMLGEQKGKSLICIGALVVILLIRWYNLYKEEEIISDDMF